MKSLLLLILFFSNTVWAQIQVTDVDYASGFDLGTTATAVPEIYGGISGDAAICTGLTSTEFCNTCTTADLSCNRKRIHDDLELEIKFKVTGDIEGEVVLAYGDTAPDTNVNTSAYYRSSGSSSIDKDSEAYIRIAWSELCLMIADVNSISAPCDSFFLGGDAGTTTNNITLFIGLGDISESDQRIKVVVRVIEPNYEDLVAGPGLYTATAEPPDVGLDSFVAVPGDEKIYIDQLDPSSECPDTTTSVVKKFRVFYSDVDFDSANYPSSSYKDFNVDDDCDPVGDWAIEGLTNGVYYHTRAAIVDEAQNVAFLTDSSIYTACAAAVANDTDDAACVYAAKPDNVLGLLTEDFNCFVATATFGSGFHVFVRTLREFRNQILLPHRWGRDFVRWYYKVGPGWAKWISDKPTVKTAVGVILTPITGFAWFSLYYGLTGTILASLCVIFGLGYYSLQFRQNRALAKIKKQNQDIKND